MSINSTTKMKWKQSLKDKVPKITKKKTCPK